MLDLKCKVYEYSKSPNNKQPKYTYMIMMILYLSSYLKLNWQKNSNKN